MANHRPNPLRHNLPDDYDAAWWSAQTPRLPAPPANYDDLVPLPPVPVAVYYANAWDAPERD